MFEITHSTIPQLLRRQAQRFPDREAVVADGCRLTYDALWRRTERTARALRAWGIEKGEHVGLWANDGPDALCCLYALWRLGAVAVPLCTGYSAADAGDCIKAADIGRLLIDGGYRDNDFPALCARLPLAADRVCRIDGGPGDFVSLGALCDAARADTALSDDVRETDPDTILFTSGTTGGTRPVLTTHFARVNTLRAQAQVLRATPQDRFCSALPAYHCFSLTGTVLACMAAGGCLCFPSDRRTANILDCIERERCTILTAVPTLFSALLRTQTQEPRDVRSLRAGLIGGSTYTPEFFKKICDVFDFALLPSLGQTEATAGITAGSFADPLEKRAASLGRMFPGIEGSIREPGSNAALPCGETGEICLRGYNVMTGYYKLPRETAAVVDGAGWLHTGDLGSMDAQGYLYYAGRCKELIIRGGENIAPCELETVLLADARVAEAKVIGVPDSHYIEEIAACVVPAPGARLSEDDVQAIVGARLSGYKIPRYVFFFPALPRGATGKVELPALRQAVRAQDAARGGQVELRRAGEKTHTKKERRPRGAPEGPGPVDKTSNGRPA